MCPPFNRFFAWRRRRRAMWVLAGMTIVFALAGAWFAKEMQDHGVGILELEFVRTSDRAQAYYDDLDEPGRNDARAMLVMESGFLISYGLFLIGACSVVAERNMRAYRPRLAALGSWIAWGVLVAAIVDAVASAMLLVILGGHTGQPWPAIVFGCAIVKFPLIGIALLYALIGWVRSWGQRPAPAIAH